MKLNKILFVALLFVFSNQCFALAVDEWEYKTITSTLKATPGCKDKEKASKQASTGRRFKKYAKLACNSMGMGWGYDSAVDKGKTVCDACEDDDDDEGVDPGYSCYMQDVVIKCKTVKKGW